ncbi:MAG: methylated-DNA--[protein]-cysteine S-methyltransferase [Candidatus Glassbacteria bacterium]|nr:methylated-DNA--[protein]-cysteine S-methyltransferase [Candidatus Glassbacteria bacterium]
MAARISICAINSPLGKLHLAGSGGALAGIEFSGPKTADSREALHRRLRKRFGAEVEIVEEAGPLNGVISWLEDYFADPTAAGTYRGPLDFGGTDFQKLVWMQLLKIPAGRTRTYREVALRIGRPAAVRAVGSACGANPVPIVVPCHRVVASDGIGGFGGGLELKRRMLAAEGVKIDN